MPIPKLIATAKETYSSWHEYATLSEQIVEELRKVSRSQAAELAGIAFVRLSANRFGGACSLIPHVVT